MTRITENSFLHTSFKQTNDFGYLPCNGLIVRNSNEVIIFDTPTNDKSSEELINRIKENLYCKINAIIPTHHHDDYLAGLKAFHEHDIPSLAYFKTIDFAKERARKKMGIKFRKPKGIIQKSIYDQDKEKIFQLHKSGVPLNTIIKNHLG